MNSFAEKYAFFIEIAQCGSITRAAEKLYISQPALSKYLQRLEASLGTKLFDRTTIPLQLTRSGEIFLRYVTQSVSLEKQYSQQLDSLKGNLVETLRIGSGPWRASCILPHVMPQIQEKYPFVKFEIVEGVSDMMADGLQKGTIDVCILGCAERYPNLETIPLSNEKILFLANNTNPTANEYRLYAPKIDGIPHADIRDFQHERFIISSRRQRFAHSIYEYFEQIRFKPAEIMEITNLQTGMYMTAQGNYISFLPDIAIRTLLIPETLTYFSFGEPPLTFPISFAYRKGSKLSTAGRVFLEASMNFYSHFKGIQR